jgi:hypothetical protein
MAHCVHAPVNPMQPASEEPVLDRSPTESERPQLPAGDDAVMQARELGKAVVKVNRFRWCTLLARLANRFRLDIHTARPCSLNRVFSMRGCEPSAHRSRILPAWPRDG